MYIVKEQTWLGFAIFLPVKYLRVSVKTLVCQRIIHGIMVYARHDINFRSTKLRFSLFSVSKDHSWYAK